MSGEARAPEVSILALLLFLVVLALLAVLFPGAIGEARIAQSGPDRQHTPGLHILHERNLGKPLCYAVIMHQHRSVVIADLRDALDQARRQIEPAALPVARQVLGTLLDRTIAVDDAGTGDTDERRKLQTFGVGFRNQALEHFDQPLDRAFPRRLVIGVTPEF